MALLRGLRNEVLSITQSYPRAAFTHLSNAATNGMCSKCFREEQASQDKAKAALAASAEAQHAPVVEAPAPVPAAAAAPTAAIEIARASTPTAEEGSSSAPVATVANAASPSSPCKPNSQHRYAEAHSCTFEDYKTAEREKLAANNPLVQASKVERI
ncbi:hypothetical protein MNEG_2023 [Monoraphidium neglectum]|uniref:A20-type domain-containing protein n=1 Tax=Monoraphidium neglectum TaxID=145388 RepID=A0A0D2NMY7_9CHLO|nr:hypothetical protein MNEG_2023 [Monoraphidium neglectum]KIZ05931.1 hypothetical protein MNEG_2023 [Monoraphidium neglectum]|eukprot:XP_013904950.1 hypothetical protein MNEG_2023 [Monoraphidium neglectum]